MLKKNIHKNFGSITKISETIGEHLETKIERILTNNEPISDGAPIIYMERKEGVQPQYDVRTDRFDIALEATTYITKSKLAKREERQKEVGKKEEQKEIGKTESTQGTKPPDKAA